MCGKSHSFKRNKFWGNACPANFSTAGGAVYLAGAVAPDMQDNEYNKCLCALNIQGSNALIGGRSYNDKFGNEAANTVDITLAHGGYYNFIVEKSVGSLVVDTTDQLEALSISSLKIVSENSVAKVDRVFTPLGNFARCGVNLADATVHTDSGYSLRMQAIQTDSPFTFSQDIPTGNIQGKDMVITVWVKINSATYWAGTHQNPRLVVEYDNGANTAYTEATETTDWQMLTLPFTPATDYGKIKVYFSVMTDALNSDAYVYFDDMSSLYPSGVTMNLGSMDVWTDGLPMTPMISTSIAAADVWSMPISALTGAGTVGKKVKDGMTVAQYLAFAMSLGNK